MSEENVEHIRRGCEAFARRDWDATKEMYDPAIEWVETPSLGPDAATYVGPAQVRAATESWMGMWSDYDIEFRRFADAGDEVVVLARERGTIAASGAVVERELGQIFTWQGGRVVRVRLFGSWAEALAEAGVTD